MIGAGFLTLAGDLQNEMKYLPADIFDHLRCWLCRSRWCLRRRRSNHANAATNRFASCTECRSAAGRRRYFLLRSRQNLGNFECWGAAVLSGRCGSWYAARRCPLMTDSVDKVDDETAGALCFALLPVVCSPLPLRGDDISSHN
jgi:hypothetical protein